MISAALYEYITSKDRSELEPGFLAYLANLECVASRSPQVARAIVQELVDQRSNLKLIASENYASLAVQCAMANLFTDKYAEGIPSAHEKGKLVLKRFYAGCDNVDQVEDLARNLACQLFGAEHAYVQPHSGADANMIAFWAILRERVEIPTVRRLRGLADAGKLKVADWESLSPAEWDQVRHALGDQTLLGLDFRCGGHLTHGYRQNVSGKMFRAYSYTVSRETGLLDYDQIRATAREVRPLILLAGYSAYPRRINFRKMREIADEVGAVLMVDMAHFAGLVAGKVFQGDDDPVAFADVVTTTTHKTLRGPRGGLVLCKKHLSEQVDRGCPLVQGGPLGHVLTAKALCFTEALTPEYQAYARRIVENSSALAAALAQEGFDVLTGGTDNHLLLVNLASKGLTGHQGESAVRACGVTLNRNAIPFDPTPPTITSGLRLGTPATTTLGMGPAEMREIASIVALILGATRAKEGSRTEFETAAEVKDQARKRVVALLDQFRLYKEIDLDFLRARFLTP